MKLSHLLLAGASLLVLTGAASAADLIVDEAPAPVVAATADWSGLYGGFSLGYGAGTIDISSEDIPIDDDDTPEDIEGWFGGVQLGYNFQADTFLVGVQTDFNWSGIAYDEDGGDPDDTVDWFGSTTVRVGAVLDTVLPYFKVGVAYGGGTGAAGEEEDSQSGFGWTAGLGVEVALTEGISAFAEYDYYDLGEVTYEFTPGDVDADTQFHTIKAGLNFSF